MTATMRAEDNRRYRAAILRMITRRSFMTKGAIDTALQNAKEQLEDVGRTLNATEIALIRASIKNTEAQFFCALMANASDDVADALAKLWELLYGEKLGGQGTNHKECG